MSIGDKMLDQRVFPIFRTSFLLTDRDAFVRAVGICRDWISQKGGASLHFPNGEPGIFHARECRGATGTITHEDGQIWAARLEDLRETEQGRNWTTDLFVEARGANLVRFGAELVLRSAGRDAAPPGHSRPRVVREIVSRLSAEADGVTIAETAEVVEEGEIDGFLRLLTRERRRLPMVAISRDETGAMQLDANAVAQQLAGAAHVRIIESAASWKLTQRWGKRWSVYNTAVRIFYPGIAEGDDPYRHPLALATFGWSQDELLHWLSTRVLPAGFRDAEQDARFWRVGILRQAATAGAVGVLAVSPSELEALRAERDQAKRDKETAEALMEEADRARQAAEAESSRLAEELAALRSQIALLPAGVSGRGVGPADVFPLVSRTLNVANALTLVEKLFEDRLIVLPSAYSSAKQALDFQYAEQALDLLWKLATDYWSKLVGGEGDVEARKVFGKAYAAKEASSLSAHGKKGRTFTWNGEEIFMEKHLKIGVKDSFAKTLRIHFFWCKITKKIIIGHCGPHIPF